MVESGTPLAVGGVNLTLRHSMYIKNIKKPSVSQSVNG